MADRSEPGGRRPSVIGAAPWRRAPRLLAGHPASLLAVLGASVVLGTVAAGQSQYRSSSASGALAHQLEQRCPYTEGASIAGGVAVDDAARQTNLFDLRAATDMSTAGAPSWALLPSVTTLALEGLSVASHSGRSVPVTLYDRDGALDHVHVVSSVTGGAGQDGVWLTDSTAAQLGVRPGDRVQFGPLAVPVVGLYANLQNYPRPLPSFWCSQETGQEGYLGPADADFPPPTLALAGRALFGRIATALAADAVDYQWQRPVRGAGLTGRQGQAVVAALDRMQRQQPAIGYSPSRRGPLQMQPTDLGFVVQRSDAIAGSVGHSVEPVAVAGLLVALLLMASAASYWVDRRRRELVLLGSRGVGPAWIAFKAVLEMGPWALLGTATGVAVARGLVILLGPSPLISAGALGHGAAAAAIVLGVSLLVIAAVTAGRSGPAIDATGQAARSGHRSSPGRAGRMGQWARRAPVEPVLLAAAGVAWWRLSGTNPDLAPAGSTVASVGPLYLVFPALFAAGAAVLVARLGIWLLPWARGRAASGPGSARFLGTARLAAAPALAGLLLAASAMAVAMLVFAAAVTGTQQSTVSAKARTFVGSDTGVFLTASARLPASIRSRSTVILRLPQAYLDGHSVDVIGIDRASFARAAFWSRAYGAGSLDAVLDRLERAPHDGGALPVILANGSAPSTAQLRVPVAALGLPATRTVRVVERVRGFPTVNGNDALVVTDASELRRLNASSEVLSRLPPGAVVAALAGQGTPTSAVVSAGSVLDLSQFLSVTWSFAYLQALGVLIGLIVVAGVLLYTETRQRRRVIAYVMARRMGLSRMTHVGALALELGAPLVSGTAAGLGIGMTAAALVSGHLDPLPDLAPGPLLAWPTPVLLAAAAASALLWWSATAWSQRGAERSSAALILRGEQ